MYVSLYMAVIGSKSTGAFESLVYYNKQLKAFLDIHNNYKHATTWNALSITFLKSFLCHHLCHSSFTLQWTVTNSDEHWRTRTSVTNEKSCDHNITRSSKLYRHCKLLLSLISSISKRRCRCVCAYSGSLVVFILYKILSHINNHVHIVGDVRVDT